MIITGIGSRQTPQLILDKMTNIGRICREKKIWVRSGHADGADWAFECGAQEYCIAYLPWPGFNDRLKSMAKSMVIDEDEKLDRLVYQFHPSPDALFHGARWLMRRNGAQVLGARCDSPTSMVVCWTRDGKDSGGTGQAIRIANYYKIPVYNLKNNGVYERVLEILDKA